MMSRIHSFIRICRSVLGSDETQAAKSITYQNIGGGQHTSYAFQEVGFSSQVPSGSDLAIVAADGVVSNSIVVATNHQASRPTDLQEGEVRIYCWADPSNYIQILNGSININTPTVTINGDLLVNGEVFIRDDATISGKSFLNHEHTRVATGSAVSGPPV